MTCDTPPLIPHQTGAEIAESRKNKTPSPWRNRPKEESLKIFMDMRKGKVGVVVGVWVWVCVCVCVCVCV